uniref:Uncharacterized protein n=1 Tax=Neospora caninum (strain Liverpool) TaxID=572307 RepID=A0A0F7UMH7_NEOCL|nr:TPA: hypothetical protein BN1204_059125 [Neospora caninum Liverpool]
MTKVRRRRTHGAGWKVVCVAVALLCRAASLSVSIAESQQSTNDEWSQSRSYGSKASPSPQSSGEPWLRGMSMHDDRTAAAQLNVLPWVGSRARVLASSDGRDTSRNAEGSREAPSSRQPLSPAPHPQGDRSQSAAAPAPAIREGDRTIRVGPWRPARPFPASITSEQRGQVSDGVATSMQRHNSGRVFPAPPPPPPPAPPPPPPPFCPCEQCVQHESRLAQLVQTARDNERALENALLDEAQLQRWAQGLLGSPEPAPRPGRDRMHVLNMLNEVRYTVQLLQEKRQLLRQAKEAFIWLRRGAHLLHEGVVQQGVPRDVPRRNGGQARQEGQAGPPRAPPPRPVFQGQPGLQGGIAGANPVPQAPGHGRQGQPRQQLMRRNALRRGNVGRQ